MKGRFIVFDTEDNSPEVTAAGRSGFEKRVTQIAAMTSDGKEYYSLGDVPGFLRWVKRMVPDHVWAHNLQYDIGNLFADSLDEIDATQIGGRFIRCFHDGIEYRDSFNIWVCKVADLGEAFGLKKLDLKTRIHSRKGVMRDVEIVMRAMKFIRRMCAQYEIPKMPCTLGGLAVRIWKATGGENWQNNWPFCRHGYFGGRVELFRKEARGNLHWTDINSLYPYCMTFDYPVAANDLRDVEGFGIAGVKLRIPECFVAPLPVKMEDSDGIEKTAYPFGIVKGIWTFHEIRNAVEHGAQILKVYDAVGSKQGHPYYADYVNRFYKLRLAADNGAQKLFYKLLLNNLYGQLASRGIITKTVSLTDRRLISGAKTFGKKAFLDLATAVPEHVNYLHAAYVTSYGRLELFRYMHQLGERMIYCDTDSVIFDGPPPFAVGKELGQMKLVKKGRHCRTHAPKTYQFDTDFVAKGVPKDHAKEFIRTGKATYAQPFRFREACQFFDRGNTHKLSVWRDVTKELRSKYDKKRCDKSGRYFPKHIDKLIK